MKIELKKIKFYEKLSEETNCYVADLYIDNIHTAYVENRGRGGNTDIRWARKHEGDGLRITQAEEYCKTLPDVEGLKINLEFHVDLLLEDYLKAKNQARLKKDMEKGVCCGNENHYFIQWFKRGGKKIPISELLQSEKDTDYLCKTIRRLREENHVIMNTNIPMHILERSVTADTII